MSRQKFPTEVRAIAAAEWIESRGYDAQQTETPTVLLTNAPYSLVMQAKAAFDR
jgi:hypothetical protein